LYNVVRISYNTLTDLGVNLRKAHTLESVDIQERVAEILSVIPLGAA